MEDSATVGQRFLKLISHLGISKNAFAASLDKTATVIQHLVDERNKPGFDLLCKVFEVYPNVSKDWLLQGVGPMLTNDQNGLSDSETEAPTVIASTAQAENTALSAPTPQQNALADMPSTEQVVAAPMAARPLAEAAAAPAVAVAQMPVAAPEPAAASAAPVAAASSPVVAPVSGPADTSWQAALYTQQMAHQLALAELRNQHLQDQQRLMQQMMDLMQRQLTR